MDPVSSPPQAAPWVLVVDDDPLFRTLCRGSLAGTYEVAVFGDGHEAFGRALQSPPAAIVLDLVMPGWDGIRTLRSIRSEPSLHRTAVLVLSSSEDRSREELLELGADAVLRKAEFCPERLRQTVADLRPAGHRHVRHVKRVEPELVDAVAALSTSTLGPR